MAKLLTTLQHSDQLINRIQDGIVQVVNPLLKAWYDKFGIPGDCSGTLISQRVTLADDWIAPTLLNSWVDYAGAGNATAGYRKRNGMVEVRGIISTGTPPSDAFVLPVSYQPTYVKRLAVVAYNYAFGALRVDTDGTVRVSTGSSTWTELDVSFPAGDPSPVPNPIFPLTLAHGLTPGKHPTTVLLADAVDVTSLAHVSSSCSWKPYDDTRIQIVDLPGLYATRTYDLTFLVLGG
jgi:hypothetical protein